MKKIVTALFVSGLICMTDAQVKTPQASLSTEIEQTVGLTKIEIEYSRPNKNKREIFGNLVPYGKVWRTGANKNTTIEFSDDVVVGGQKLAKGKYAIYTEPQADSWAIYFYTDNENWGNPQKWDTSKIAAKSVVKTQTLSQPVETFTISLDDLSSNSAMLNFSWDKTRAGVKIEVPTRDKVMATIKSTMKGEPTAQDYIAAANYYFTSGEDIQQAKKWIDKGIGMNPNPAYYQLYAQAQIHMEAGEYKSAKKIGENALAAAQAAGDDHYVKLISDLNEKLSKTK